jgi:hypothetical protein
MVDLDAPDIVDAVELGTDDDIEKPSPLTSPAGADGLTEWRSRLTARQCPDREEHRARQTSRGYT